MDRFLATPALPRKACFFFATFLAGAAFFAALGFVAGFFVLEVLRVFFLFLVAMLRVYHRPPHAYIKRATAVPACQTSQLALRRHNLYSHFAEILLPVMTDFNPNPLVYGFIWYVAFLFSTTCHEAAHALVAKLGGDETAAHGGQVSLNPVPHIQREPWGMVIIPLLSFFAFQAMFGWASAPYDTSWERRYPRRAGLMALAGPTANFSLMLLAALLLRVGSAAGWFQLNPFAAQRDFASTTLVIFFSLNLLLGTFNLLPVSPLDGSTVVLLFMGERAAQKYLDWLRGNSFAMVGLLLAILVFRYIYNPIEAFVSGLLLPTQT